MSFLRQSDRISQRGLLIADDLTGGADSGAQFVKRGLSALLISVKEGAHIDFSQYTSTDVLVINTDSRRLTPDKASNLVSSICRKYERNLFPVIYKKIDSTLRGNVGFEIDAILKETNIPICFMTPAYPEQNRTLVNGILMVGGKPVALTEAARDAASPVQESHVQKLLQHQSRNNIGKIELPHVAAGQEHLKKIVEEERNKGNKIIVFDAMTRKDLRNVADVGFDLDKRPLFVGSAGLAEEVAQKLIPSRAKTSPRIKSFRNILIVSGTASSITHQQLEQVEKRSIPSFQLTSSLILEDGAKVKNERKELSKKIANSLSRGINILKTPSEMLDSKESSDHPVHLKITKALASVALWALEPSKINPHDLALILTGGETAQHVINGLKTEGIEIDGELLEGIVRGHLIGGEWDGLTVVTKAGAFGKDDALEKTVKMLETGSSSTREE